MQRKVLGSHSKREAQTLFALDDTEGAPRLAGLVMFTLESPKSMVLLHLAIHQNYTARGIHARAGVTARLLAAVRRLSLRVRGVESLRMIYPRSVTVALRMKTGTGRHKMVSPRNRP